MSGAIQPGFTHFECGTCEYDTIRSIDDTSRGLCPLCLEDCGSLVQMRRRPARDTDKVEGPDARKDNG